MKHPALKATPLTIALLLAPPAPLGYAHTLLIQPAAITTQRTDTRAIPWSDPDLEAALVGVPTKAQADRILALAQQLAHNAPRWINDLRARIDQLDAQDDAQDDTQDSTTREAEQAALTLDLVAPLATAQADLIIALLDHTSPRDDRIARINRALSTATAVEPLNTWSTIERGTIIGIASANLGELTDDNLTHWRTAALAARDQPDDPRGWILRAVPVINANALSDAPGVNDGLNLLKGKAPKRAQSLRLRLTPIQDRIALLWDQRATDPDALSRIAATAPLQDHTTRAAAAQRYATIIVSNPENLEPIDPPPGPTMQGLEAAIEALRLTAAIAAAQDASALERLVDRAVALNDPTIAYQLLTKLSPLNPSAHDASLKLGILLANASIGDTRTAWTQHALAAGVALFSANPSASLAIKLADHALALTPKGAPPTTTDTALLASITWAAQSNPTALARLSDLLTHYTPGDLRPWRIADHALRRWRNTPATTLLNAAPPEDPADDPFWAALAAWSDAGLLITQGDGVAATQRLRDTNTLHRLPALVEPHLEPLQDAIPNLRRAVPQTPPTPALGAARALLAANTPITNDLRTRAALTLAAVNELTPDFASPITDAALNGVLLGEAHAHANDNQAAFAQFRAVVQATAAEDRHLWTYWHASARILEILASLPDADQRADSITTEIQRLRRQPTWNNHPASRDRIEAVANRLPQ